MTADAILDASENRDQSGMVAEDSGKPPLVAIVGPTASGKSAVAVALAGRFQVEIVNADSRAFYRGMDIGTAKPSPADLMRVPHHLVDILELDEPMSLPRFQHLARVAIAGIHQRGRLPLLVGGTPQYVNALLEGWQIPEVPPNEERRRELEREAERSGVEPILARLAAIDPESAARTGPNLRRIIRALEVHEATGVPFSALRQRGESPYRALELELWLPREVLYERIDRRADEMLAAGLVDEVRSLLARGLDPALPAFSSIGYRQLVPAIAGNERFDEAIARIKTDTHRLVRHQQTWFRKNARLQRVDMTRPDALDHIATIIERFLRDGAESG